ncbi:GON-4-like protein, partial [Mustelus asterias]
FEEPLVNILTEQHRTVKAQIEQLRQRKVKQQALVAESKPACGRSPQPETLTLDQNQKRQLQQQMQQHVQLLSQVHLLTSVNPGLSQEADMSLLFLKELASFAEKASELYSTQGPDFTSSFAPCNLTEALALLEEFDKTVKPRVKIPPPKDEQKMNRQFDESNYLPREVAWILATRDVFMYPELLPHCALQPKQPKDKASFSKGEGNLLVLGLKHFEGTDFPKPLISQYLMPPKTDHQLSVRIKNLSVSRAPDNVIKLFKKKKVVEPMPSPFTAVGPEDRRPAIEREENKLPYWLQRSLPSIRRWLEQSKEPASCSGEGAASGTDTDTPSLEPVPPEGAVGEGPEASGQSAAPPLLIPPALTLLLKPKHSHLGQREVRWRRRRPTAGKPVLIHPAVKKAPPKQLAPVLPLKQGARPPPRLIQPAPPPVIPQAPGLPPLAVTKPPASPWLLTVPPGVQLVSLSGGCNVIDVPAGQTLRVATMVVRPAAFACPVSARLPSPGTASGAPSKRPPAPGESPLPGAEVPDRCDPERGAADPPRPGEGGAADRLSGREGEQAKEAPCPQSENVGLPPEVEAGKTEPAADPGDRPGNSEPPAPGHKEPPEDSERPPPGGKEGEGPPGSGSLSGAPQRQPPAGKQQLILGLGQELDIDAAQETPTQPPRRQPGPSAPAGNPSPEEEERESAAQGDGEERPHSPGTAGADTERQPEKSRESVSAEELAVSPEELAAQADKAGQEEEDDEDFDDLTQDEEDEEVLSSASEESALSVPELQETMEKLTWLASERRLSQEGDSEEENSQEENSEPEEEEEAEGLDLLQKETGRGTREMAEKERRDAGFPTARRQINTSSCLRGEVRKLSGKGKAVCRSRAKRGRRRISKDTSKLLLLYDEDILNNDPLREQKDMAFAQAYLSKVREALQDVPGKYEDFLRILYDFETNPDQRTAVDLYGDLCDIIQDWPQLLKDFAAFLLPEQALQCGLFEEQQAFDKSRKFLRQLEICFGENPSHYQKIIKALQSCMVCSPPDMAELKVQVWQLLKGHHHLQDEFSLFFDNLRPPSSRISDFEEVNWMEDKEYEFDGFEEVVLPDLEEEEELQKMTPPPRSKRRREGHTHEKVQSARSRHQSLPIGAGDSSLNIRDSLTLSPGETDLTHSPRGRLTLTHTPQGRLI